MRHTSVGRGLERVAVPDAEAAEARVRDLVLTAFVEREPVRRRRPVRLTAALAAVAAAISRCRAQPARPRSRRPDPSGRRCRERRSRRSSGSQPTVAYSSRRARRLGRRVERLEALAPPATGRRAGRCSAGTWSQPARTSSRRSSRTATSAGRSPAGTCAAHAGPVPRRDTRIAYLSAGSLRVVGGDGSNDRPLRTTVSPVAPAWRGGRGFVVTYVDAGGRRRDRGRGATSGAVAQTVRRAVLQLAWSTDGRRLVVRRADRVDVLTRDGSLFTGFRPDGSRVTAAALRARTHENTHAFARAGEAEVVHVGEGGGRLFAGAGRFSELAWSPDGRWLLVGWPTADQWVFVRADGRRIRAVSNVSGQFRSRTFPRIEGWCCAG